MPSSLRASSSNTRMNSPPMILRLLSGSATPASLSRKRSTCIHIDQIGVHLAAEYLNYLLRLALAEQAVVHVNTGQLLADGLDEQGGHHRGVHTAAEGQQNLWSPTWLRISSI